MHRLYSLHQHMFKVHLWSSLRSVSEGAWPVWQLAQHTPHAACSGHGTTGHRCTYATLPANVCTKGTTAACFCRRVR